jgi:mono/diheme cytochrome c family protein
MLARIAALCALVALWGCERAFRNMYDQPRHKPLAQSALWPDGRSSRPPPDGVVSRSQGTFAGTTSGRLGAVAAEVQPGRYDAVRPDLRVGAAAEAASTPIRATLTSAALARGRERFDIFCSPCHSIAGDGDGMVARRGFPHPPSFHIDRLRNAPDSHFYAVITEGYGAMHSYATRVPPADRLAIIAYIRALQLSQHAPLARLEKDDVDRLLLSPASPAASLPASAPAGGRKR